MPACLCSVVNAIKKMSEGSDYSILNKAIWWNLSSHMWQVLTNYLKIELLMYFWLSLWNCPPGYLFFTFWRNFYRGWKPETPYLLHYLTFFLPKGFCQLTSHSVNKTLDVLSYLFYLQMHDVSLMYLESVDMIVN